jgi:hypothetical protein
MRRIAGIGLVLAALSASTMLSPAVPAFADHPEFTSHAELLELLPEWERLGATIEIPAVSDEGRDIPLVAVGDGPFTVLITSELHANEPSGTEAAIRLIWALLGRTDPSLAGDVWPGVTADTAFLAGLADEPTRRALLSRVTVVAFPMLDPDGAENAHTRDFLTNTDYATRITPSTAALVHAVQTYAPDLLLDLHGGPNEPMNIGLVEPYGTEPAVIAASRAAAATAWRATVAVGAEPLFFEEHPFALMLGEHSEPFSTADEAYYAALSRGAPFTMEAFQLEGIPAVYTETVGLQSSAPEISIVAGASLQEAVAAALLYDGAGLLTNERPGKSVAVADGTASMPLSLPFGATRLLVVVRWAWQDPAQDWSLRVVDAAGAVVAEAGGGEASPYRRSRAVAVADLPPGEYRVEALPGVDAGVASGVLRALWYEPDPGVATAPGIVDGTADPRLCLPDGSLWRDLVGTLSPTAALGTETCAIGAGVPGPPADYPDPAPLPPDSTEDERGGPSLPSTGGGLAILALGALAGAALKVR